MTQLTYEFLMEKYHKLSTKHSNINNFDFDSFVAEFEGQNLSPISDSEDKRYYVSMIDPDLGFRPGNVQISTVENDYDLAKLPAPAL